MTSIRLPAPLPDQDLAALIETFRVRRAYLRAEIKILAGWFYENLRHTATDIPMPYLRWRKKNSRPVGPIEPSPFTGYLPVGSRTVLASYEDALLGQLTWRMATYRRTYRPAQRDGDEGRYGNRKSWEGGWSKDSAPTWSWIASKGPSKNTKASWAEQARLAREYVRKFIELTDLELTHQGMHTDLLVTLEALRKQQKRMQKLQERQPWLDLPTEVRATRTEPSGAIARYARKPVSEFAQPVGPITTKPVSKRHR